MEGMKWSILLVDDSPEDRAIVRSRLARDAPGRFEVREAALGEAGLAECRVAPPDCLLLNHVLRDMLAEEFLASLRREAPLPPFPVVVLTAHDAPPAAGRVLRSGAQDYVVKGPGAAESLHRVVENAIERHRFQRELHEERAAADSRCEQIDAYTAAVAHDLRSPLSLICMCAHLSLDLVGDAAGAERLRMHQEMIVRSAHRASRLVQDLLDVTRIEAGSLRLESGSCDAGVLVEEAAQFHRGVAAARDLLLLTIVPEALPAVLADREQVLRVFQNLLDNAVKFTPPGGRITVGAEVGRASVRFSVRDTGSGISSEQLPHVFDRFWQARTSDVRGVGLGLTIARGIVEAHGGCMEVESRPGSGTTFAFTVPFA